MGSERDFEPDDAAVKPGPASPQGGDIDVPTPPGGPQRQDAAETPDGAEADEELAEQRENAATSLDQPSDG